jgi:hypothetical protein
LAGVSAGREVLKMRRLTLLGPTLAALVVFAGGFLTGCESDKGTPPVNILPGVELTATPPAGDTTRYDIEFHWTGWDEDGEVDYFEYYIDPPLEFIQNPATFPDTMTWRPTEAYSGRFTFYAPEYDTSTIDNPPPGIDHRSPQIGLGYHVFAIRAVDDMGGRSIVNDSSWVAFTAATICPRSVITSPPPRAAEASYVGGAQEVGTRVTFRWEGADQDGIFSDRPTHYLYKLTTVQTPDQTAPGWTTVDDSLWNDPAPWVELEPGQTQVVVELDAGYSYGFGVRAVDEARSIEPLLVLNRNLLWVGARERSAFPDLSVRSASFGNRDWRGWFIDIEEYEVPLGSIYEFTIAATADVYGGLITGYSYGWNLKDVEDNDTNPSGIGGWTPWSTSRTTIVADFSEEFTNKQDVFLYVKAKDDGGAVTLATIKFNVVTLNPDKKLAYIDDWRFFPKTMTGEGRDDLNWQMFMRGYDYGLGWDELVWDEWDAPYGEEMPTLKFLSRFENLVWSMNDRRELGADQKSAFYYMSFLNTMNVLAVYLGSEAEGGIKGKCWIFGNGMTESTVLPYGGNACGYPYPVNEDAPVLTCTIRPRSFSYDFMHLRGTYDRNEDQPSGARVQQQKNAGDILSYIALDMNGPGIENELYVFDPDVNPGPYQNLPEQLRIDLSKPRALSMQQFETLEHPAPDAPVQMLFFNEWTERNTGLVPLYKFRARDRNSRADNRYCAFRYIPSGRNDHGEIVYFWFQMYPLYDDVSRQLAKAVLTDMFGLPDPD